MQVLNEIGWIVSLASIKSLASLGCLKSVEPLFLFYIDPFCGQTSDHCDTLYYNN
ncbi:hypothetical protein HanPSC8_Chr04g0150111 [Helianthus annuus]|nr:hypothetical protein HanPSC8_Chr04g0150111 [Helianthus annuus]